VAEEYVQSIAGGAEDKYAQPRPRACGGAKRGPPKAAGDWCRTPKSHSKAPEREGTHERRHGEAPDPPGRVYLRSRGSGREQ
jgi:hypothetical protein